MRHRRPSLLGRPFPSPRQEEGGGGAGGRVPAGVSHFPRGRKREPGRRGGSGGQEAGRGV